MLRYFDGHCDSLYIAYDNKYDFLNNEMFVNIENRKFFEKLCQIFAVWINDDLKGDEAYKYVNAVYDYAMEQEKKHSDYLKFCKSLKDYEDGLKVDKLLGVLMLESANTFGGKLEHVKELYNKGFRMVTMTWNGENDVGFGCNADPKLGLKSFGKEVLKEMAACGMVCDVSHLNDQGFEDAAASGCLMIATHTNSRKLMENRRNITDEQFLYLKKLGTGVGINLYPPTVGEKQDIEELVDHMDHYLELGGEDNIFIGADFDGIPSFIPKLKGIEKMEDMYKIADVMKKRGYTDQLIDKIFFGNMDRIIRMILN